MELLHQIAMWLAPVRVLFARAVDEFLIQTWPRGASTKLLEERQREYASEMEAASHRRPIDVTALLKAASRKYPISEELRRRRQLVA